MPTEPEGELDRTAGALASFTTSQGASTPIQCPSGYREIYVNASAGSDANAGRTPSTAIATLSRARAIARAEPSPPGYCVLLRESNTFTDVNDANAITNAYAVSQDPDRADFAFLWDVASKPLVFTSYNMGTTGAKPVVMSGKRRAQHGATVAFGVMRFDAGAANPGAVTLHGIRFTDFQLGGVQTQSTTNTITIEECEFDRIGTRYYNASASATEANTTSYPFDPASGSYDMMRNSDYDVRQTDSQERLYAAGVFYIHGSRNVVIRSNTITNGHNDIKKLDKFHVFYISEARAVAIQSNVVSSTSGPPLKIRHAGTSDVDVWNNTFTNAGPTRVAIVNVVQPNAVANERAQSGFFQYAGDTTSAGTCGGPHGITIRMNHFQRPYCYGNMETCSAATMSSTFDANGLSTGAACDNSNAICAYARGCTVSYTANPGPASGDAAQGVAWVGNDWNLHF